MVFGACSSTSQDTTWPSSPLTSTVNRQCGLDHTHLATDPLSVDVVDKKSVEPLWWPWTGTAVSTARATATPTTIIARCFICASLIWPLRDVESVRSGRVAEGLVVVVEFHRRTVACHQIDPRILQRHAHPHRVPRARVDLRIVDRLGPFHGVVVEAVESLGDARLIADRPAGVVEPHAILRHGADGHDFERVIVDPPSDRVAEPPRLAVLAVNFDAPVDHLRQRPPVGPDHPPAVVEVVEHRDQ